MLLTLVVDTCGESIYHSNKAIKMMNYVHRLTQLLFEEFPEQREEIERRIQVFIEDEKSRHKDVTADIGSLMVYLTLTEKFSWEDLREAFLGEQFDRQIFWILKQIPELEEMAEKGKLEFDEEKIEAAYKSSVTGFRIIMLLKAYNT